MALITLKLAYDSLHQAAMNAVHTQLNFDMINSAHVL